MPMPEIPVSLVVRDIWAGVEMLAGRRRSAGYRICESLACRTDVWEIRCLSTPGGHRCERAIKREAGPVSLCGGEHLDFPAERSTFNPLAFPSIMSTKKMSTVSAKVFEECST